jgi:predicted acyltransferase
MRAGVAAGVLVLHWALLTRVPFGGLPAMPPTPTHNLAAYLDTRIFGRHILSASGDPEGLLGTLPAIGTALIGTLGGDWLRHRRPWRLTVAGGAAGSAALLAGGGWWSIFFPLNKPLWTGSFVLVAAGFALLLFTLCYVVLDVAGVRRWARPFAWLGINPLAIYFLSELTGELIERPWLHNGTPQTIKTFLYWTWLEPQLEPAIGAPAASLAFALAVVAVWLAVAAGLARRQLRIGV